MRLVKAGRIPSIKLPDGQVRIDAAVIEKLLRKPTEGEGHE